MKYRNLGAICAVSAVVVFAHPMGNFSVSHYTRLDLDPRGAAVCYVLDLAEIPTFQLLQQWKLDAQTPREEIERRAVQQAREWTGNLTVELGGTKVTPQFERAEAVLDKGAGGMAVLRVTAHLRVNGQPGTLRYEDANYPDRAGWKEIVIAASNGALIDRASPATADRSSGLTKYPDDPMTSPSQDLKAEASWHAPAPHPQPVTESSAAPVAPASVPQPGQSGPGMVVRDDYLSRLLQKDEFGLGTIFIGMCVAFGLGAVHALSPGHGKTIVAAYLVGNRGTAKHAVFLGAMVTFTHTISVFGLGLTTWYLSRYVLPEKIYPVLGAISGISIVWIGGSLFFRRLRSARRGQAHHANPLLHDHGDGHVHSHLPEGEISMGSLIALGASGGLVPCPSALVLLLSSVALGRVALGLTLLVAFSLGLALVLMAIGLVVLYAKHLLPDSQKTARSPFFRYVPVASAGVITCAGLIMTGVALGYTRP
jgi:ABC-type nickel/cobalt efflux system permease component RcnA